MSIFSISLKILSLDGTELHTLHGGTTNIVFSHDGDLIAATVKGYVKVQHVHVPCGRLFSSRLIFTNPCFIGNFIFLEIHEFCSYSALQMSKLLTSCLLKVDSLIS